jgi:long-chain acyl-CoA synthetase
MNKPWLTQYPDGVPETIDPDSYRSLADMFEESFQRFADRAAFIGMGVALSYGQLDRLSRNLAAWLQDRGLQPGDRVAIMLPNCLAFPVALAGVLRAGGVVVNVNPMYTARELEHQLKDSGARVIIALENMAATVQAVLPATPVKQVLLASLGDFLGPVKGAMVNLMVRRVRKLVPAYSLPQAIRLGTAVQEGEGLHYGKPPIVGSNLALLQYTGGRPVRELDHRAYGPSGRRVKSDRALGDAFERSRRAVHDGERGLDRLTRDVKAGAL